MPKKSKLMLSETMKGEKIMERNNGKIIAIVALVVAVIGLSLGFAAFTTQLSISTAANVSAGTGNWSVGFSTNGTSIVTGTDTKTANAGNAGVLSVTKYTLSQSTNAELNFSTTKSASYTLSIVNEGSITAYLDKVDFSGVTYTCTNATAGAANFFEGSSRAGASTTGGNSSTISPTDCANMFSVTLTIDGHDYTTTQQNITGVSIPPTTNNSIPVTLTIAYKDDSTAQALAAGLDGDIVVSVGTIVVDFKSTANSGS